MATISKRILSGSTDGFPITVSSTAISGTTLHVGPTSTNTMDRLTVYAFNSATVTVTLWAEWGNAGSASQRLSFEVAPYGSGITHDGLQCIIPGLLIQGRSATGASIMVGASTSMVIQLYGEVDRIVQ